MYAYYPLYSSLVYRVEKDDYYGTWSGIPFEQDYFLKIKNTIDNITKYTARIIPETMNAVWIVQQSAIAPINGIMAATSSPWDILLRDMIVALLYDSIWCCI